MLIRQRPAQRRGGWRRVCYVIMGEVCRERRGLFLDQDVGRGVLWVLLGCPCGVSVM